MLDWLQPIVGLHPLQFTAGSRASPEGYGSHCTVPRAKLPAAYARMGSRNVMGKLVLVN